MIRIANGRLTIDELYRYYGQEPPLLRSWDTSPIPSSIAIETTPRPENTSDRVPHVTFPLSQVKQQSHLPLLRRIPRKTHLSHQALYHFRFRFRGLKTWSLHTRWAAETISNNLFVHRKIQLQVCCR
jgi:hypothetical protein